MRCLEFYLAILTFFSFHIFSQDSSRSSYQIDSTKNNQSNLNEELKFKNFFQHDSQKIMSINDLSSLKLYAKAINDSAFLRQYYFWGFKHNYKDETEGFKESFKLLMDYAKHNQNKYDLGVVTKYLGISQKVMAIILAIISVIK